MTKQIVRLTLPDELYEAVLNIASEKKMPVRPMIAKVFRRIAEDAKKQPES